MDKQEALDVIKEAIQLLSPIPENEWLVDDFTNEINACCVIGHFQRLTSDDPNNYIYDNCSDSYKVRPYRRHESLLRTACQTFDINIAAVNNGQTPWGLNDKQFIDLPTPKERVLAALNWIVEGNDI